MLTALVPCFNESGNVSRLVSDLAPELDALGQPWEILAIDDGSTDDTSACLNEIAGEKIRVAAHPENRGLGAAIRTGIREAKGQWCVVLDADMTFHPRYIARLWEEKDKKEADCVLGSPILGGMPGVSLARRLPSLMLNYFYRGLFVRRLSAYTPMFRLYRTAALRKLELQANGFEINVEILVGLLRNKAAVEEVPVPLTVRAAGVSKLQRWRELRRHAALVWRLISA